MATQQYIKGQQEEERTMLTMTRMRDAHECLSVVWFVVERMDGSTNGIGIWDDNKVLGKPVSLGL